MQWLDVINFGVMDMDRQEDIEGSKEHTEQPHYHGLDLFPSLAEKQAEQERTDRGSNRSTLGIDTLHFSLTIIAAISSST